ncbi:hypothetical protein [Methylophilus methylotrophus]|uniref:hypothetical protein n=1 Tax=Methylophilus methylotrophus TaxID=17 RepID=UPI000F5AF80F|nr:hypothetical protein [Methylophilus methylotrophus]
MHTGNLASSKSALRKREGIPEKNEEKHIGSWSIGQPSPASIPGLVEWASSHGVAHVVWTNLPPKFNEELKVPSADEVVNYLEGLVDTQSKEQENEDYYAAQLEFLQNKVRKHASIIATRSQIDPIKALLIELEKIVGNECYNGNIQNYGSWGELESEGRKFRYPVKFYTGSREKKCGKSLPTLLAKS